MLLDLQVVVLKRCENLDRLDALFVVARLHDGPQASHCVVAI